MSKIKPTNLFMQDKKLTSTQVPTVTIAPTNAPITPTTITYVGLRPIYQSNGQSQIPDPLNAVNVNVSNNLITENLTVNSGTITLSDTAGNQTLQAVGTDLFFDGQLLAKAGDIQNISDWATYPANADINADGKNIENVLKLSDSSNVFGSAGQYLTSDGSKIEWITPPSTGVTQLNTLTGNVTISSTDSATLSVAQVAQDIQLTVPNNVSQLNGLFGSVSIVSTDSATLTVAQNGQDIQLTVPPAAVGVASVNSQVGAVSLSSAGSSIAITNPSPGVINLESTTGSPSTWANFSAGNTVNLPDKDFNMTTSTPGLAYNKATLNANVDIGSLSDAPLRPDFNAYCGTVTLGGITSPLTNMNVNSLGTVNVNSVAGVSLVGGGGVSVAGAGGVAVTGVGAISVQGGGINVNGGAVNLTSTSALNIASGGIAVNGGGIVINGGGVAVNAGALTIASGTVGIGTIASAGGGINVFGSDLTMIPVGPATSTLRTELITSQSGSATLAISNVATINGVAYPPPGGSSTLGKYGSTSGALALTGTFANMATQTFTTTTASAPLLVWGNFNVLDGGSGAVIEARLLINGTGGLVITKTMTNGHNDVISLLGNGIGPLIPGLFNVAVQARVISGSASRVSAQVITNAQFTLSV